MTQHRATSIDFVNAVTRHRLLVGLVIAMTALAAHADTRTMTLPMEAGKDYFMERCFKLELGQQLAYQVSTRHAIDFNVHHHPGDGETVFPDKRVVRAEHSNRIVAESAGVYCFMATNVEDHPSSFDVVIEYEIREPRLHE